MDTLHTKEDGARKTTDTPSDDASLPTTDATASSVTPDMTTVMDQLPLPRALRDWLICVRKPALSLRYRVEKRHIPDLNAEPLDGASSSTIESNAAHAVVTGKDSTKAPPSPVTPDGTGKNSDLMTLSGGFTIRYFDLAAGVFGLLLAGCLFRGCCWVKRRMK